MPKTPKTYRKEAILANFLTRHFNFLSRKLTDEEIESVVGGFAEKVEFKTLALYIATSYIANALSKCEIKVIYKGDEARDYLYYRLNVSPNPNQSGAQFMNGLVTKLCLESEALVIPHKDDELYLATSFAPEIKPMKDHVFKGIVIDDQQIRKNYKASDCYFFKLEDRKVRGFINSLYDDYGKLMAAAIQGFIQSHGRKYKLKLDNTKVGDAKFAEDWEKVVKNQLKEFVENANAIYPQYQGYDLEEMRHEADGASGDILAMRKEIFDVVAQAYKIPTSMMYGNTNNTSEVVRQFLTFAVDPIAQMLSDELTRKSFTYEEWRQGSQVIVDTKRINHVDIFDVADKVDKLISSGVFSIDDVLSALGYQPLNTEFSTARWVTKNYELAEDALNRLLGGGDTK